MSTETTVAQKPRLILNPQDRTNVMRTVAMHVNAHAIARPLHTNNPGYARLYDKLHGETFLTAFFESNVETINKIGQLASFVYFRTITDDVFGKECVILLANGLLARGFIGHNGYDLETIEEALKSTPKPVVYVKLTNVENETVISELSLNVVVAINTRIDLNDIKTPTVELHESLPVPLVPDESRNTRILAELRSKNELTAKKRAHTTQRRSKNQAQTKARRASRK